MIRQRCFEHSLGVAYMNNQRKDAGCLVCVETLYRTAGLSVRRQR